MSDRIPRPIRVEQHDKRFWEVIDWPFEYKTADGDRIIVPIGFLTDFASVPWFLRWLTVRDAETCRAATIHDWLYQTIGHKYSREECDEIFYEIMLHNGVNPVRAWVLYKGVRIGGWVPWNRYHKNNKQHSDRQ